MNASSGEYVRELPLFPLPLVLFPNMMVPLHIFEERYKTMINGCLEAGRRFGIVLALGQDVEADTVRIGCTARIVRVERLSEGRMNIEVVGEERFRVLDSHENRPYRTGVVESYADSPLPEDQLRDLADEVRELLSEFLNLHLRRMGREQVSFELPPDPATLSFTASCVLPIEASGKQTLLEYADTALRLGAVRDILELEVSRLRREQIGTAASARWSPVDDATFSRLRCPN
jgi:Lon protease-like protein